MTKVTGSASNLTAEESRILIQLRDEFDRRGEFNRIFPTEDTWSLYGDFLESLYSSSPGLACPGTNFNRMVHEQLYPASPSQAGAKLPPKVPRHRPSIKRVTKSAPVRSQMMTMAHFSWRSLNDDSDIDDAKPISFYEEANLQHISVENHSNICQIDKNSLLNKPVNK